ncbi:T9SS type A sorting domain-containing protein [bacterium]|nr:T9SS type A sorting domain-containing protein [bacterium]
MNRLVFYTATIILIISSFLVAQEIPVSIATGNQYFPNIASSDSTFFIVWQDHRVGESNLNIFGQLIYPDGTAPGAGFAVCTLPGNQRGPVVGGNSEGYFIAWIDEAVGAANQLKGRYYCPREDSLYPIRTLTDISVPFDNLAIASDGRDFLLVWENQESNVIEGSLIYSDGTPSLVINEYSPAFFVSTNPDLAWNGENYLVVWETAADRFYFHGQLARSTGNPIGSTFPILEASAVISCPSLAWNGLYFLLVYDTYSPTTWSDVYGQMLGINGSPIGSSFVINSERNNQQKPDACSDNYGFLSAWQDGRSGLYSDIFGQPHDMSGSIIETPFIINDSSYTQEEVKLAWNGRNYCATWGDWRNGLDSDIYAMILATAGYEGPSVRIIEPLPYTFSSCIDQQIILYIDDVDGINTSTIELEVEGRAYSLSDPQLSFSHDTLYYNPIGVWSHGDTVEVCLLNVEDLMGHPLGGEICWEFITDFLAPVFSNEQPVGGSTTPVSSPMVSVMISDALAPVNFYSLNVRYNGISYDPTHPCVTWNDTTLTLDFACLLVDLSIGDSVEICVTAGDTTDYCENNNAVFCWYFKRDSITNSGPIAEILHPFHRAFSACEYQSILIYLWDEDGIDPASIELMVAEFSYTLADSELYLEDDTLYFDPVDTWSDGSDINVCLYSADDFLGNPLDSSLCWDFIIDLSPPTISHIYPPPETTVYVTDPVISAVITDTLSGVNPDSLYISIDCGGYDISHPCVSWDGSVVELDLGCLTCSYSHGDTVRICIRAADDPDYCEANETEYCWYFLIGTSDIEVTIEAPMPGTVSGCEEQDIELEIYSPAGIDPSSIELWVGRRGSADTYTIPSPNLTFFPPALTFYPDPFFIDAETVYVALIAVEDSLGNSLEEPISWEFYMDFSLPLFLDIIPEPFAIANSPDTIISVRIYDPVAGLDNSSVSMTVNGIFYYLSDEALTFTGDLLCFDPAFAEIPWLHGDTINVCVHAQDDPDYCEPHYSDSCWYFTIAASIPPTISTISIEDHSYFCSDSQIFYIILNSESPVDDASIELSVNGVSYNTADPALLLSENILYYNPLPDTPWADGDTIGICLLDLADIYGIHIEGTPLCWEFYTDFTPPVIRQIECGPHIPEMIPICFYVNDEMSGIDSSYLGFFVDGDWYGLDDPRVDWLDDSILVFDFWLFPTPFDSFELCARAADYPYYCEPNVTYLCTTMYFPTWGPVATILQPLSRLVYACEDLLIIMLIEDEDGIDPTTILLEVQEDTFFIGSPEMTFSSDTLYFTAHSPDYEGEVEVCLLEVNDLLGNPLEHPICWSFMVDHTPPYLAAYYPGPSDLVDSTLAGIWMEIPELTEGSVDILSIMVSVDEDTFYWGLGPLTIDGSILSLPIPGSGIELHADDTVQVCLEVSDMTDYCEPNWLIECWSFLVSETGIDEGHTTPAGFCMDTSYPNPFNSVTRIPVYLAHRFTNEFNDIRLVIYDIKGKVVEDLTTELLAGLDYMRKSGEASGITQEIVWEPEDLLSGLYFVKLNIGPYQQSHKIIYLK